MAPEPVRARAARFASMLAILLFAAGPAEAFRIVDYNITNYPGTLSQLALRQPEFRNIMASLGADVVVCQEVSSQAGVDSFLTNVLNVVSPGQWAAAPFLDGNDTNNALFYRPTRVELMGSWHFYPNPDTALRLVSCYRLRPVDSPGTEFRIYSQHLKASSGSANENQRLSEAIGIRDSMNAAPAGTTMILCGDFNIYGTGEACYRQFLASMPSNVGRLADPLNPNLAANFLWNNVQFAPLHTQCPCLTCPTGSGFSGGGLDDRFDMFLPTLNMVDGEALDLLVPTMKPVGNDGLHYNLNMTDAPVIPEGAAFAYSLWRASDHLPLRVDLQLPARASTAAELAFGSVITGAVASLPLAVANADAPSDVLDELTYSFAPPAGFTAPGGTLNVAEGGSSADAIGMDTATPGVKGGVLGIATDDPDHAVLNVTLSGTVLRHAVASLDSAVVLGTALADFGTHPADEFDNLPVRVHNQGWDALQARLALASGVITGGDGRFSIVGGFASDLLAGTGRTYSLAFDPAGATEDSLYEATLTFGSTDEALPGATARPDLVVTLRANVEAGGTTAVDDAPPSATLLYAPFPNPIAGRATVRFDLARAGDVALEVFDLSGRRASTLLRGTLEPGRYSIPWNGLGEDGVPVRAGLYFVRLKAPGAGVQSARVAVIH
jgi:endonuclease/exonuclease/phosphatase family metal-dependent hydrolase